RLTKSKRTFYAQIELQSFPTASGMKSGSEGKAEGLLWVGCRRTIAAQPIPQSALSGNSITRSYASGLPHTCRSRYPPRSPQLGGERKLLTQAQADGSAPKDPMGVWLATCAPGE